MKLKRFNEFYDLGRDTIWGAGKVGQEVRSKAKAAVQKKLPARNFDASYKAQDNAQAKVASIVKPHELVKHTIKPLSDQKKHADYTVHHVKGKDGMYDSALLHHSTKGFVGLLNGTKKRDGFHVSESFISAQHRGKGLGVALYDHAANHHKGIVSDSSLTAHSQKIYGHFAKEGRITVHAPQYKTPLDKRIKDVFGNYEQPHFIHGEPVKVATETKRKSVGLRPGNRGAGKTKERLVFSTEHHADLSRSAGGARLRIEPKPKKSK